MRSRLFAALFILSAVPGSAADPARRDDAYHAAQFRDGQHDANYAEWWYFNLTDPSQDLQLAVTYMVIDPANLTGVGLSSVAAIAYSPAGAFTETAVYPATSFLASAEQADVLIAGGAPPTWNSVRVLGDDVYQVAGAIHQQHDVSWNLVYLRRSAAWLGIDRAAVGVFPWETMGWLQYMPSAFVTGEVVVDGRAFHVTNVRGYHDHNWGEWIPFTVKWNWAQYAGPGLTFSIGDFMNNATGVVSVESFGQRTVFEKDQVPARPRRVEIRRGQRAVVPGHDARARADGRSRARRVDQCDRHGAGASAAAASAAARPRDLRTDRRLHRLALGKRSDRGVAARANVSRSGLQGYTGVTLAGKSSSSATTDEQF